jgi:NAD+ kinase
MTINIKTIGIIAKDDSEAVKHTVRQLVDFLRQKSCEVLFDQSAEGLIENTSSVSRETLAQQSDLAIVVGGDGTFLSAVRSLADFGTPVLGINLGRLGFLVDISPDHMLERLQQILDGQYVDESRFLLEAEVIRSGETVARADAFNDVVVHIRDVARMIEFETYINGQFVNFQRSDGLVISTPTGSTAYSLAAGGPVIHPAVPGILMTPICPFTLTNRPLIIPDSAKVTIRLEKKSSDIMLTFDGQEGLKIDEQNAVVIQKSPRPIRMVTIPDQHYFDVLKEKLRWSGGRV